METLVTLNEYEYAEMKMAEFERDNLLTVITRAIRSDHYVDPQPVFQFLATFYPNRLKHRLEELYAQGNEDDENSD